MPDLTPSQIEALIAIAWSSYDTQDRLAGMNGDWETAFITARKHGVLFTEIIRQLQREKACARKQGWQDAGLSLDAQEVLAASLTAATEPTA